MDTIKKMRKRAGTCCVVNQHCTAPANCDEAVTYAVCIACAQHVCKSCSIVREWYGTPRQRVCHNCIADHDGADGREQVAAHIHVLAGYSAEAGIRYERMLMAREAGHEPASAGFHEFIAQREYEARVKIAS